VARMALAGTPRWRGLTAQHEAARPRERLLRLHRHAEPVARMALAGNPRWRGAPARSARAALGSRECHELARELVRDSRRKR
jgi:hypothetical protein